MVEATLTTSDRLKTEFRIDEGDSTTLLRKDLAPFSNWSKQELETCNICRSVGPVEKPVEKTTVKTIDLDEDLSGWLSEDLEILEGMRSIPRHWESSDADPPNSTAIGLASEVLIQLSQNDFRPDHIDPSTDEGVCISVRRGKRYADIECFNDGGIFAVISKDDGDSQVWEVEPDEIKNAVREIQRFILQY